MDTLYTLCRATDNRFALPLKSSEALEIAARKKTYFSAELKSNPLGREILARGQVTYEGIAKDDSRGFLRGPATFFRTHEILRKTRVRNTPIKIGREEYSHDEVVAMFARCLPNVRLRHVPWYSFDGYCMSLGLAWSGTLLTAHLAARANESDNALESTVLFYMGTTTTAAALAYTALRQNRDVRHAAPWNSALYLDLNAELLRRDSSLLAVARKEFLPQQSPFKTPGFYYALARKIEAGGFDKELSQRLAIPAGSLNGPMAA